MSEKSFRAYLCRFYYLYIISLFLFLSNNNSSLFFPKQKFWTFIQSFNAFFVQIDECFFVFNENNKDKKSRHRTYNMKINTSKYEQYTKTDMAREFVKKDPDSSKGLSVNEEEISHFKILNVKVENEEGSRSVGKPVGTYISIETGKIWLSDDSMICKCSEIISEKIKLLLTSSNKKINSVLVIGLGNPYLMSDSIGPLTIKEITPNNHLKDIDPHLYSLLGSVSISAFSPGVTSQTGMEAASLIKNAVDAVKPSAVICIDALATRDVNRLGTTVQLSDTGISPGSGIGNSRAEISKKTLGVPVIAVGVPTVVDCSTLVYSMLREAGIEELSPEIEERLENGKGFFVTLKDADSVVREISSVLSRAITLALN